MKDAFIQARFLRFERKSYRKESLALRAEVWKVARALGEEVTVASEILSGNVLQALWRLWESEGCGPSHVLVLFRKEKS